MDNTGMTLTAMIRTFSQYVVIAIFASNPVITGINWVTEKVGVPVDTGAARVWLEGVLFALIVGILTKLGQKFPFINQLFSWGRSGSSPVYVPTGDTTIAATITPAEGTTVFTEAGTGSLAPPVYEEEPRHLREP